MTTTAPKLPPKDELLQLDYTELLRLATNPEFKDHIFNLFGIRGISLNEPYSLYPYQVDALKWLRSREALNSKDVHGLQGGIVRMVMGLGKTYTFLVHILSSPKGEFPSLVICSKTIMNEWKQQIEKFLPDTINVLYLHRDFMSARDIGRLDRKTIIKYDIVLTTYDVALTTCANRGFDETCLEYGTGLHEKKVVSVHPKLRQHADMADATGTDILYGTPWERVIADESQRFANHKTQIYKAVMALYGKWKWCMTGTPIRNYETDIWAQLRFCGYSTIDRAMKWKRYCYKKYREHKLDEAIYNVDREKANIKLPEKHELTHKLNLNGKQKEVYDYVLGETRKAYDEMLSGLCDYMCVLAWFTRLRQVAIAPYLIMPESKRKKPHSKSETSKEEVQKTLQRFGESKLGMWCKNKQEAGIESAKIQEIIRCLKTIPKGEKVLIFSIFTSCLDLVADAIEIYIPEMKYEQVDGDVVGEERNEILNDFRKNKDMGALLMSYKVGSEGLNLTEANHCICIEPWWSPAIHSQAKARCWRNGQTKEVKVYNIYSNNTIEKRVLEICQNKETMTSNFLDNNNVTITKTMGLDKYTMGQILGRY